MRSESRSVPLPPDIAADIESSYIDAVCGMAIYAAVAVGTSFLTQKSMKSTADFYGHAYHFN